MDVAWPYKRRLLGNSVTFTCPSNTATWEGREEQVAACVWHRQTDSMVWWPAELHPCNSELHITSYLCSSIIFVNVLGFFISGPII